MHPLPSFLALQQLLCTSTDSVANSDDIKPTYQTDEGFSINLTGVAVSLGGNYTVSITDMDGKKHEVKETNGVFTASNLQDNKTFNVQVELYNKNGDKSVANFTVTTGMTYQSYINVHIWRVVAVLFQSSTDVDFGRIFEISILSKDQLPIHKKLTVRQMCYNQTIRHGRSSHHWYSRRSNTLDLCSVTIRSSDFPHISKLIQVEVEIEDLERTQVGSFK